MRDSNFQVKQSTLKSFFGFLKIKLAKNQIVSVMTCIWTVDAEWDLDFDLRSKILILSFKWINP